MSMKAWECVKCGTLFGEPAIDLATVKCGCGVGAGRWTVATLSEIATIRARLAECERERDAAQSRAATLAADIVEVHERANQSDRERDAWREDAQLRAIYTDAARAELAAVHAACDGHASRGNPNRTLTAAERVASIVGALDHDAQVYRDRIEQAIGERDAARARLADVESALSDALDLADEGWGYADQYFREKWECVARSAKLRALLPGGGA